jgi:hypothetical protein
MRSRRLKDRRTVDGAGRDGVSGLLSLGFSWPLDGHRVTYGCRAPSVEPLVDLPLAPFSVQVFPSFGGSPSAQGRRHGQANNGHSNQNDCQQQEHGADLRHRTGVSRGGSKPRSTRSEDRRLVDGTDRDAVSAYSDSPAASRAVWRGERA